MLQTKSWMSLIAGFAVLLFTPAVYAVPLGAFGDVAISGTTAAGDPTLAGPIVADTLVPFDDGLGTRGQIQTRVVENISGLLDFYFRVFNNADSSQKIMALRTSDYTDFPSVDVDFRLDGLGAHAPDEVKRVGSNGLLGVNFLFNLDPLNPGEDSYFFYIRTSATHGQFQFGVDNADLLVSPTGSQTDTHLSGLVSVYQPGTPVPEPETWALMVGGLAVLAWWAKRRVAT